MTALLMVVSLIWMLPHRSRNPLSAIKSQEKEKKKKYLRLCLEQRRTFVPLVVSVDGVIGKEGRSLLKQFSLRLTDKWMSKQLLYSRF